MQPKSPLEVVQVRFCPISLACLRGKSCCTLRVVDLLVFLSALLLVKDSIQFCSSSFVKSPVLIDSSSWLPQVISCSLITGDCPRSL